MRTDNRNFQIANVAESKEPRHVLEIYGDTNTYYILSDSDIVLPGVSSAFIIESSFIKSSVFSQAIDNIKANSTIGRMSFEVLDITSQITDMLAAIEALGESLRLRKIVYKYGYKGNEYSDFITLQTQEINDTLGHTGTSYKINARDVMRSAVKNIFTPKTTTLMSSISKTAVQIPAKLVTEFEMITHTSSFTDAPSATVGYFRLENEVIRWTAKDAGTDYFTVDNAASTLNGATTAGATSLAVNDVSGFSTVGIGFITGVDSPQSVSEIRWTGITAASPGPGGTLTGVTGIKYAHGNGSAITYSKGRGAFGTVAVAHNVDASITDDDRKPKIEEWIYLEMPGLQMYLTIATNTIYGTANTIPTHWGLGISTAWIATSTFDNIGTDIFDPSDNSVGLILRGEGLQKEDAKSFLQEEILRACGVFDYILADGQIAVKRMDEPLPDAPYVRVLDNSQLVEVESMDYDYNDIYNEFEILWNWNAITESYTRRALLVDQDSIDQNKFSKRLTLEFKLLHGSRHTEATIIQLLNRWRSRHAYVPIKGTLKIKHLNNDLEIGDLALLNTHIRRDFLGTDTSELNRTVEIQRITNDPNNGGLKANFFAATKRATPLNLGSQSSVLDASYYTATGTDLSGVTSYFTDVSSVLHCDTSGYTMTGNASINNTAAHYYVDGDLTIDAGVTLSWTDNVLLKVNGYLTIDGLLESIGAGLAGVAYSGTGSSGVATSGNAGFFGITKGGGGLYLDFGGYTVSGDSVGHRMVNWDTAPTQGANTSAPRIDVTNNAGQLVITIDDLRATSGGSGQQSSIGTNLDNQQWADGGDGGAAGGSIVIVCKGMSFGVAGYINTSGVAGTLGTPIYDRSYIYPGKGSSGHPGGVWVLLDGNTVAQPSNKLIANYESSESPGYHVPLPKERLVRYQANSSSYFNYLENRSESCWVVQRIPDNLTSVEDQPEIATVPTAITVTPGPDTTNTINTIALEVGATAPSDGNYRGSMLYVREFGTNDDFGRLGQVSSTNEQRVYVPADGTTLEFRAYPISQAGVESTDYIDLIYTVASENDTKVVQGGKVLVGSATDYLTGNGIALVDDAGTAKMHVGNPAGNHMDWTGAALNIVGNLTVGSDIAGWTIGASTISGGGATLDSSGKLTLGSGAASVVLDAAHASYRFWAGNESTPASAPFSINTAGAVKATTGTIGGWSLSGTQLIGYDSSSPQVAKMWLDSVNQYLAIGSNSFSSAGIQIQYNSGAPRMYLGDGASEYLQYSAGALAISGGTLSETVYEIYTSGLIRNNASPSTNGGFQLDNNNFRAWNSASPVEKTFDLDFSDGSFVAGNEGAGKFIKYDATANELTVTSLKTAASGKRIELNPASGSPLTGDNELHFYGDRGDTTIEELATIGITTEGSDEVIINLGSANNQNVGVRAETTKGSALIGTNGAAIASVNATASSSVSALKLTSTASAGFCLDVDSDVSGYASADVRHSGGDYALSAYTTTTSAIPAIRARTDSTVRGAFHIYPKANTTDPTGGSMGDFVVLSDGTLKYHDGTSWRTVTVT